MLRQRSHSPCPQPAAEPSQTKIARNFPRSLLETIHKRCNCNDVNSRFEVAARELRAKLLGARHSLAPERGSRGGRRMVCEPSWGTRRRDILRPATVPPMRRPTDVRKTSDSQISHAIPPAQEATHAQKPQNINDSITRSEIQSGELHAKLQSTARVEGAGGTGGPGCGARRRRRSRRAPSRRVEPHISDPAPLVWRVPEGPEGTGGPLTATSPARLEAAAGPAGPGRASRRRAERSSRRGRRAGGQATRRPEIWRGHKHHRTEKPQNSS